MSNVYTIPSGAVGPLVEPSAVAGPSRQLSHRRFVSAILALIAGILGGISTVTAWWTDSFTSPSSASEIHFLPGGSLTGTSSGGTVSASYAGLGFGPVGALYEAILAMALAVMVLGLIGGIVGLLASWGRLRNPNRNGMVRGMLVVVLVIALFSVIIVPSLQPYTVSNSAGGCLRFRHPVTVQLVLGGRLLVR